ncbi:bifunctional DNA primase/polymerase [Rubellimicrobium roseum]|uniref:DNA primase/polymerase bifunctional N-terminal domain-containing protein n=1 Tax=Rubellimicrobium roseum TaxID=687525 RepID=A0A5C4NP36_9RHOB|nr:bifunctional DNA primase/polymerase [Rubellimicrobium roseum]TNC74159.1 hypothetical protein FHG71_02905 [Rubellimicrobium roseum]
MNARAFDLAVSSLPSEMARLHGAGFSLLPLGRGADGKAPLLGFSGTARLPLKRVLAPMHRTGSTCYGIRLGGLAVIDCDSDDPALVSVMEARFGASPVHIRTPRGRHLFYRAPNIERPVYPNLRGEGHAVDLKRGATSYVMGPGSVRPDGGAYFTAKGVLGQDELPVIALSRSKSAARLLGAGEPVPEGGRHDALLKAAIATVGSVNSLIEMQEALTSVRDHLCVSPTTLPEEEVRRIGEWAWRCRLEGHVYCGRASAFRVERQALDALKGAPNRSDAVALFITLQDQHGHRPGYAFALDHTGMLEAGHTDLTRRRFAAARDMLLSRGLLQVAANHCAGRRARTYRLARPLTPSANVTPLHGGGGAGGEV